MIEYIGKPFGDKHRWPRLLLDDVEECVTVLATGTTEPYPESHHVTRELSPATESIRIFGVKFSSTKKNRKEIIRSLRKFIGDNKDKAKTGHWF